MVAPFELWLRWALPAPPERVWRALTEPAALAAWFWPAHLRPGATLDPRVGGAFRIEAGPGAVAGGLAVGGEYIVVAPLSRLAFTWRWDGEDEQTLATLDLAGPDGTTVPDPTTLTLTHEGFADEAARDRHVIGWNECLARLPAYLAHQWPG